MDLIHTIRYIKNVKESKEYQLSLQDPLHLVGLPCFEIEWKMFIIENHINNVTKTAQGNLWPRVFFKGKSYKTMRFRTHMVLLPSTNNARSSGQPLWQKILIHRKQLRIQKTLSDLLHLFNFRLRTVKSKLRTIEAKVRTIKIKL